MVEKANFSTLFEPGGTPRPPGRARAPPEATESIFHRFGEVPGRAFGSFGVTLGTLWPPSASLLRTGGEKKWEKGSPGPRRDPTPVRGAIKIDPGHVNVMKTQKIQMFSRGATIANFHPKGWPGPPKSELLDSILTTLGVSGRLWAASGATVRDHNAHVRIDPFFTKKTSPGHPQMEVGGRGVDTCGGEVKHNFGIPGEVFV